MSKQPTATNDSGRPPEEVFIARMKRERERRGWSQAKLADEASIITMLDTNVLLQLHATAITKLEWALQPHRSEQARGLRLNEAVAIADAFGLNLPTMLSDDDLVGSRAELEKLQETLRGTVTMRDVAAERLIMANQQIADIQERMAAVEKAAEDERRRREKDLLEPGIRSQIADLAQLVHDLRDAPRGEFVKALGYLAGLSDDEYAALQAEGGLLELTIGPETLEFRALAADGTPADAGSTDWLAEEDRKDQALLENVQEFLQPPSGPVGPDVERIPDEQRNEEVDEGKVMFEATAPNAPCPCGSGMKYKRCHGGGTAVEKARLDARVKVEKARLDIRRGLSEQPGEGDQ